MAAKILFLVAAFSFTAVLAAPADAFAAVLAAPPDAEKRMEQAAASVKGRSSPAKKFLSPMPENRTDGLDGDPDAAKDLSDSESMEAAITEMMMAGGKAGFAATPMGGSVKMIQDLIGKTMIPKIKSAHTADQRLLDKLIKEVRKCGSTKNSAFRGARTQFIKYKSMSKFHKRCRSDEAVRYTSKKTCRIERSNSFKIKVLKCKAFAAATKQLGTTQNNVAIAKKASSERSETYIRRLSSTICGKHVHGTRGTVSKPGGLGGGLSGGILDKYLRAKEGCGKATVDFREKVKECKRKAHAYNVKKGKCNQYQDHMDGSSCKRAVIMKDACESYAGCYQNKLKSYQMIKREARSNERDRKAEWRGVKRMQCLISSFMDGKVSGGEVDKCKGKAYTTDHLKLKFPKVPTMVKCAVTNLYPSTGAYKRDEFAPLPFLAKGKESLNCQGVQEIATTPNKGSPSSCTCQRVTLNGAYSAGPMVKCTKCLDIRESRDRNSCPSGTKLFAPASKNDWKTFFASAGPLRDPNWVIDVTSAQNGCGGCTSEAMNSGNRRQDKFWTTSDGAPWWLRSSRYGEPNGDYAANCYMDLSMKQKPRNENFIRFNDHHCNYHSKSYYCQPMKVRLTPRAGSPKACKCSKVDLTGSYSAGYLIKCEQCISVSKSRQKNSCPGGMKIFSPRTRSDWRTFLKSAGPLRAPHWIIDITRPQNGCGGCTKSPMNSKVTQQMSWRTSDGSPWFLRSTRYTEPNGDYTANCFLNIRTPTSENTVKFNDWGCKAHSRSYYCQPIDKKKKTSHRG